MILHNFEYDEYFSKILRLNIVAKQMFFFTSDVSITCSYSQGQTFSLLTNTKDQRATSYFLEKHVVIDPLILHRRDCLPIVCNAKCESVSSFISTT